MERVLTSQILKLEKQNLRENDQKIKIQKLNQFLSEKLEAAITQSERRYMSHTTVGFINQSIKANQSYSCFKGGSGTL